MATKLRVPVIAVTPVKGGQSKSRYSANEKQSLLDNFDLEVTDRTNRIRDSLAATLESFLRRQETEVLRIPKDLRGMTLAQLSSKWGGSWKETMQRITKDRIDAREKEQEKEEAETRDKALGEGENGKRKRVTAHSVESTPVRGSKTARRTQTPANSRRPPVPSSASSNGRRTGPSRSKASSVTPIKPMAGPSSLPQDFQFNPAIPSTSFSIRVNPAGSHDIVSDSASSVEPSEDEDDLPDADAYEARQLAKSTSRSKRSQPSSKSGKLRRAPSLHFRQSLDLSGTNADVDPIPEDDGLLRHVVLGDGRIVSFNPLRVNPEQLMAEIAEKSGMSAKEQIRVAGLVKEEVVKALTDQIGLWKV